MGSVGPTDVLSFPLDGVSGPDDAASAGPSADRDWIVGDGPSIADLSCCGYLFYPEPFGFDRKDWPHIDVWLARIAALPGWKHPYDLMQRAFPA